MDRESLMAIAESLKAGLVGVAPAGGWTLQEAAAMMAWRRVSAPDYS